MYNTSTCTNEGTKVQNPRRLCHVHRIIASIHVEIYNTVLYTAILICIRGQMRECTGKYIRKFGKDKSSEK